MVLNPRQNPNSQPQPRPGTTCCWSFPASHAHTLVSDQLLVTTRADDNLNTHSSGLPPSATICSRSFSLRATIDLGSLPRAVLPLSSLKLWAGRRRGRAGKEIRGVWVRG